MSDTIANIPALECIDHLGIAVPPGDLERQVDLYKALGFREVHREDVAGADQVREVLLEIGDGPNAIQLLEPLSGESPVASFLRRNDGRPGIAHVAYRTANAQVAFDSLRASGFQPIDKGPRAGSRQTIVFFVHPKPTEGHAPGYLIEVVQLPR